MTHCDEAVYVATLMMLYVGLPDTPWRPPPLAPIRSLAYFQPVIAELQQQPRQPDTSITSASNSRKWRLCGRKPNPAYETLRRPSAIYPQQRVPLPLAR
jgi:hypothetical protein